MALDALLYFTEIVKERKPVTYKLGKKTVTNLLVNLQ